MARQGNVYDFRRLHPTVFKGEESHLNAEQWLIDTENLLVATRVSEVNRVDVVKIQLTGVPARAACRGDPFTETRHLGDVFRGIFGQFFLDRVKTEMEQKFINLRQVDKTVDEYAIEFFKLSRF